MTPLLAAIPRRGWAPSSRSPEVTIKDASGGFEVFEVVAPTAPMAPPHVSPWTGVVYLVEGRITALVDGTSHRVEPAAWWPFRPVPPSTFEVVGDSARFVAITCGDGAGRFFADFASSVPADQPVEDSMTAILSATGRRMGWEAPDRRATLAAGSSGSTIAHDGQLPDLGTRVVAFAALVGVSGADPELIEGLAYPEGTQHGPPSVAH